MNIAMPNGLQNKPEVQVKLIHQFEFLNDCNIYLLLLYYVQLTRDKLTVFLSEGRNLYDENSWFISIGPYRNDKTNANS